MFHPYAIRTNLFFTSLYYHTSLLNLLSFCLFLLSSTLFSKTKTLLICPCSSVLIRAMVQNSSLNLSSLNGASTLRMGSIPKSCPRPLNLLLLVENLSQNTITANIVLSDSLAHLFALVSVKSHSTYSQFPKRKLRSSKKFVPAHDLLIPLNSTNLLSQHNRNLLLEFVPESNHVTINPATKHVFVLKLLSLRTRDKTNNMTTEHTAEPRRIIGNAIQFDGHLIANDVHTGLQIAQVRVIGRHCQSWLQPQSLLIDFGHCNTGTWTYKDFSVRNRSEISTLFSISVALRSAPNQPSSAKFRFINPATGRELDSSKVRLGGRSSRYLRVGFIAYRENSEEHWFSIQNLENAGNFWHVCVSSKPTCELIASGISVSCGVHLNFGQCYSHRRTHKNIRVQNNYNEAVCISLESDIGEEISYEINHDWRDGRDELLDTALNHPKGASDQTERAQLPSQAADDNFPPDVTELLNGDVQKERSSPSSSLRSARRKYSKPLDGIARESKSDEALNEESRTRVEENIKLRPGQSCGLRVSYTPKAAVWRPTDELSGAIENRREALRNLRFQLLFKLPTGERQIVQCSSRVCESIVRLERNEVHLGDCNVLGMYKSSIGLVNCSDLSAAVSIDYVSKCVVADSREIIIGPKQAYDLNLRFVPRHVNPNYHKEITITNLRNPKADRIVFTLRANCVDRQGISFHTLFYKILAPEPTNEIDFGIAVANHPAIRAFRIRNETPRELTIRFERCEGVKTYISSEQVSNASWVAQRVKRSSWLAKLPVISSIAEVGDDDCFSGPRDLDTHRSLNALLDMDVRKGCVSKNTNICSLVEENDKRENGDQMTLSYKGKQSEKSWAELVKRVDENDFSAAEMIPTFFSNHDSEMRYANKLFRPIEKLKAALRNGCLSESNLISLKAHAEYVVIVSMLLTDEDVRRKTKLRAIERKIMIRMLEFDENRLNALEIQDPKMMVHIKELLDIGAGSMKRELLLTARGCKSVMKISPLHQLNFGTLSLGEQKDKAFNIVNLSEAPLLYEIRKAKDCNSTDLRFNVGTKFRGAVRPYFTKVVPFIFGPKTEGKFEERIIVENLLDSSANCEVVVKAVAVDSPIVKYEEDSDSDADG